MWVVLVQTLVKIRSVGSFAAIVLRSPGGEGAMSQGQVCANPGFESDFYNPSSFGRPLHTIQSCIGFGCGFYNPSSFGHPFHISRILLQT